MRVLNYFKKAWNCRFNKYKLNKYNDFAIILSVEQLVVLSKIKLKLGLNVNMIFVHKLDLF